LLWPQTPYLLFWRLWHTKWCFIFPIKVTNFLNHWTTICSILNTIACCHFCNGKLSRSISWTSCN
jgi:hypothetical protein